MKWACFCAGDGEVFESVMCLCCVCVLACVDM